MLVRLNLMFAIIDIHTHIIESFNLELFVNVPTNEKE